MPTELVLFYILAAGAVLSSAAMLLPPMGRSPVHSAISLIVSFFFLAGVYALMSAHLLTALQIIVYAGAVMVLFTFVIMLLNLSPEEIQEPRISLPKIAAAGLSLFLFGKLATAISLATLGATPVDLTLIGNESFGTIETVGRMLYTTFMVPFELISVLLLVAAVGAVVLAKKTLAYKETPAAGEPGHGSHGGHGGDHH